MPAAPAVQSAPTLLGLIPALLVTRARLAAFRARSCPQTALLASLIITFRSQLVPQ